jgi:hypothetical protein
VGSHEVALAEGLRRVTREEFDLGLRHAVTPVFAAVIGQPA